MRANEEAIKRRKADNQSDKESVKPEKMSIDKEKSEKEKSQPEKSISPTLEQDKDKKRDVTKETPHREVKKRKIEESKI